jgi:hypothetical protein
MNIRAHAAAVIATLVVTLFPLTARSDMIHDNLQKLWSQYHRLGSIHFKARMTLKSDDGHHSSQGTGSVEFWANGPNYRILQLVDDPLALPGMKHDVRWDGVHFQHFDLNGSTLFISKNPDQIAPYLGDNPLLFPFVFIYPAVRGSLWRWADVCAAPTLDRIKSLQLNTLADGQTGVRGTDEFGAPCTYVFEFGASPANLPTRIRAISAGGSVRLDEQITYGPIQSAGGTVYVAMSSKGVVYDPDTKKPVATGMYETTLLEAGAPIPAETFTVDYQKARNVVDLDLHVSTPAGTGAGAGAGGAGATTAGAIAPNRAAQAPLSIALTNDSSAPPGAGNWLAFGSLTLGSLAYLIYLASRRLIRPAQPHQEL